MATKTLGTSLTTTLTAIQFSAGYGSAATIAPADWATMMNGIKDDSGNVRNIIHEAFSSNGRLLIPNRGYLQVNVGDWVGFDSQGWPILVSKNSIANGGSWTHS